MRAECYLRALLCREPQEGCAYLLSVNVNLVEVELRELLGELLKNGRDDLAESAKRSVVSKGCREIAGLESTSNRNTHQGPHPVTQRNESLG